MKLSRVQTFWPENFNDAFGSQGAAERLIFSPVKLDKVQLGLSGHGLYAGHVHSGEHPRPQGHATRHGGRDRRRYGARAACNKNKTCYIHFQIMT